MRFEFSTANRIVFGPGSLSNALEDPTAHSRRALVVTGRSPGRAEPLLSLLQAQGVSCTIYPVSGEPTTTLVEDGVRRSRQARCETVFGIGGGSVIDAGKAIAALLTNPGTLFDYLEVIGEGRSLPHPAAPYTAVPTTAGTGAEVTRNAVLASLVHRVKVSLRSPYMLPRLAVVDPELTRSMPPPVTAATGMDALTQCLEAYVSRKANPLTDSLSRDGLRRCGRSLRSAFRDGQNLGARTDMALASLFSGLALANGGLGAVHGIAGPLGGRVAAPHGVLCGRLLPSVLAANLQRLQTESDSGKAAQRFDEVAQLLTGHPAAIAADGSSWLRDLVCELNLPPLTAFGLAPDDLSTVAAGALKASSMQGNPVPLSEKDILSILEAAVAPD
jgi:alcohol dehydrogenase class IV